MHPAPSVILFTALSGIGLGLLSFLSIGFPDLTGWSAAFAFTAGFALTIVGLISSTFHLGNPQRALKAFTQWRSSWLSREAWLAVLALGVTGIHAFTAVILGQTSDIIGVMAAVLCLATVYATAMIYTQIKAVPRWHTFLTPVYFLTLSFAGGALLAAQAEAATFLVLIALAVQIGTWRVGDGAFERAGTTLATATGLGSVGSVRSFEPPHTGENYLLKEMGFVIGRKHAFKLRMLTVLFGFILPLALLAVAGGAVVTCWFAATLHLVGVLCSRWLFFAEAEHVVGLYYGRHAL